MTMNMKMKNRSHRHGINRPKSRYGRKSSKYKKCLSVIMFLCIKKLLCTHGSFCTPRFGLR